MINPRGKYAMVIYVSILILFPCLIVVLLSLSAVWLSSTLVTVDIWKLLVTSAPHLRKGQVYPITKSSDLADFQLCYNLDIGKHAISFLEFFYDIVVLL